jgi:hypothetical protein
MNKHKQEVAMEYNWLDEESKHRDLDANERERMKSLDRELDKIWSLEEIKVRQRARDKQILEGDRNTAYFHAVANHRNMKKRITSIKGPHGIVTKTSGILKVVATYYKDLFSWENRGAVTLDNQFWDNHEMVTYEENLELIAPFSEVEIKKVIFDSYAEGAPGPYGLSFLFYQKFWDVIKWDLIRLV